MNDAPQREPSIKPTTVAASTQLSWRLKYAPPLLVPDSNDSWPWIKSTFDYVLAALLLLPAIPLMVLAAMLVRMTSRGPAFYVQTRVGRHGRPYRLIKIRTMIHDCERLTGAVWSKPDDPRITPIGHFLRQTHLDELPQLFNVLRGEMSLVGPRPERPEIVPALEAQIPGYLQRLHVKPGVTGLAQVQLPADTDLASVRRKLAYDVYYVRRHTLWLDFRLIVCTAFKCFGMSYKMQRRLFALPHPETVEKVSQISLQEPRLQPV